MTEVGGCWPLLPEIYGFEKLLSSHQLLISDRKDKTSIADYHHKIAASHCFLLFKS